MMVQKEVILKIIVINTTFNIGSEGYTSYDFAKGLIENGAKVWAIVNKLGENVNLDLFERIIVLNLNPKKKGWKVLFNLFSDIISFAISYLKGFHVIHGGVSNHHFLSSILSRRIYTWGPALVASDNQVFGDEDQLIYGLEPNEYRNNGNEEIVISTKINTIKIRANKILKIIDKFILSKFSLIIAANKYTCEQFSTLNVPVIIIPECVDTTYFYYTEPPRNLSILTLGVMLKHEGHEVAIRAFAEILKTIPHARLTVLGDGPERPFLVRLISDLNITSSVELKGWVSRDEVRRNLQSSELVLLPAFIEEGGISTKECMSSGRPVIASNVMGHRNDIDDRVNGFLIPAGDYISFARNAEMLLNNDEMIMQISRNARFKAEHIFDYRITSRMYVLKIKKLMKEGN